jgi:hypothetical protein
MRTPSNWTKQSRASCGKRSSPLQIFLLGLFLVGVLVGSVLAADVEEEWLDSIRSSIMALDSARTTAVQELQSSELSGGEADDYRDFIVYLNTRIVNYCTELQKHGADAAVEELPCPTLAMLGGGPEDARRDAGPGSRVEEAVEPAKTRGDQTKELQGTFLEALGEFDQMLLKEEEKVAARVPSQRESGGASGSGSGSGGAGEGGAQGQGQGQGQGEGQGQGLEGDAGEPFGSEESQQAGQPGSSAAGAPGSGDGRASAEDASRVGARGGQLPPPEDDDIVARQLREAAEKETDPELKKKLWEEYWKYKGVVKK